MTRTGFFAGSFDPPTRGHLDLIERALQVVDALVVGIGVNDDKAPWLSVDERLSLLRQVVPNGVEVLVFEGLAVEAAEAAGATLLLRGVRGSADVDMEMQMAAANRALAPGLETVLMVASEALGYVSGRLVREVQRAGGNLELFVPPAVAAALGAKR